MFFSSTPPPASPPNAPQSISCAIIIILFPLAIPSRCFYPTLSQLPVVHFIVPPVLFLLLVFSPSCRFFPPPSLHFLERVFSNMRRPRVYYLQPFLLLSFMGPLVYLTCFRPLMLVLAPIFDILSPPQLFTPLSASVDLLSDVLVEFRPSFWTRLMQLPPLRFFSLLFSWMVLTD